MIDDGNKDLQGDLPLARVSLSGSRQTWAVRHETATRKPAEDFEYTSFIEAAAKVKAIVLAEAERQAKVAAAG